MKQPEKKFRAGGMCATIWKNEVQTKEGQTAEYRTVSFERSYKDKDGSWKTTNSLKMNDLPKAAVVLSKAYEFIVLKEQVSAEPAEA